MKVVTCTHENVDHAFDALGDPEVHAKILVDPKRPGAALRPPAAA